MLDFGNPQVDEVKLKLLRRGTSYLYETPYPTIPALFVLHGYDELICGDGLKHSFRLAEKRYGDALMITRICDCGYGDVEIFPPKQNRMVIKN